MCKRGIRFSLFTGAMTHGCYGEELWQQRSWLGASDSTWLYSLHLSRCLHQFIALDFCLFSCFFLTLLLFASLCSFSLFYFFVRIVTFSCFLFHSSFSCVFSLTYLIDFLITSLIAILFSPTGLSVLSICMSIYSGQLCARCGPLSQLLASWRRKEGDGNYLSWKIVRNNPLNRCDKG